MDKYEVQREVDKTDTCNHLKKVMKEKGYSKKRLVRETGLSEGTVTRLLKEKAVGNINSWMAVCIALDVELSDIIKF